MPNQLAKHKRRQSLTEHEAVLAALAEIAKQQKTSMVDCFREAVRKLIAEHAEDPAQAKQLKRVVMKFAPRPPTSCTDAATLRRYKNSRREFDRLLLELHLASPAEIETNNSMVAPQGKIRVLELEPVHDQP